MTNQQHPITLPAGYITSWKNMYKCAPPKDLSETEYIAAQAARWGADQELEACCEWVNDDLAYDVADRLRSDRRPEPLSLKERALKVVNTLECFKGVNTIRRALEQLDD